MRNRSLTNARGLFVAFWAVMLCAVLSAGAEEGFSRAVIERGHHAVTPSIGILTYTLEVTEPASGQISKRDGTALGLVVASNGLVMTHGHMQTETTQPVNIRFTLGQGETEKEYPATLLKKPDDINVCFLRLESETPLNLPHVRFKPGAHLSIGEQVMLTGLMSKTLDFARGIQICRISAILDKPRLTYCLDQPLRFGFVGGPIITMQGEVIGVAGFDLDAMEGGDVYVRSGHPLIYQTDLFQRYINQPPSKTEIAARGEDAWLGIFTQPLSDDFAEYWGIESSGGVIVGTVLPGSPAEKAGLKFGDIITSFNNIPIRAKQDREVAQFTKLIRDAGVGTVVPITYLRDKTPQTLNITLEAMPKTSRDANTYDDEVFGLSVRELTTDVRLKINLPESVQGVIVMRIRSGSFAHLAGVRPGSIILEFGGHPVTNIADFQTAVQAVAEAKPREVPMFCRLGPVTGFYRLQPRWDTK